MNLESKVRAIVWNNLSTMDEREAGEIKTRVDDITTDLMKMLRQGAYV